jgi:hypothetical protein
MSTGATGAPAVPQIESISAVTLATRGASANATSCGVTVPCDLANLAILSKIRVQ